MGITLIVARSHDGSKDEIALDEWLKVVKKDRELRLRTDPVCITNPKTKATITIDSQPGQTELAVGQEHVPFLGYRNGKLMMSYSPVLEDKQNPVRKKVAAVARQLGAVITHDASDEILEW